MFLLNSATWPCLSLGVGQGELSLQTVLSHHWQSNGLSPSPGRSIGRRGSFFLCLYSFCCIYIYFRNLHGKVLVLCKSGGHIHSYGNVVIQLCTWSLPPAVTSLLTEAETSSPKGPHSNLDGIKLLWTRQNVFILWVNAIPQIILVTYRLRWWNSTFLFRIIFFFLILPEYVKQ